MDQAQQRQEEAEKQAKQAVARAEREKKTGRCGDTKSKSKCQKTDGYIERKRIFLGSRICDNNFIVNIEK